jgi:hypothetical protein
METMQSFLKFVSKVNIFIHDFIDVVKVCQRQSYIFCYDNKFSFQGDEFRSFHGLLQGDH